MTSALTATCVGKPHPLISRAATTAATPYVFKQPTHPGGGGAVQGSHGRMYGRSHRQQWRRLSVIEPNDNELPAKPTQRTGEPEAPARASVPERFRRLKRNEVVWSGEFVADERLGFELWEAPDVFRAGSFARPI